MGKSVVTLLMPKKEYHIGEDITFHIKIESRSSQENQDYTVSLIQMYNTYYLYYRNVIQTVEISGAQRIMVIDLNGHKEVLLYHINRVVLDTNKQNVYIKYPLLESETLPSGCVFGVYRGKRYIVDYINKKANWDLEEEESLEVTQAALSGCASPILTVEVVKSVGLCVKDFETPSTVYCAVVNESGKLVKSKEVKNVDQVYENARFVIPLHLKRKNVVVYFYHKRFLISDVFLGCVEFDLTHLKFGRNIETWFYLKGGDDGNSIVSGKALIRVCYDSKEKKDGWNVVGELFRENFDYSLAHNREMEKAMEAQNTLRQKLFATPIYEKIGKEYFPVNYD
ncbi:hypothetical protein EIN_341110 [Entamoeba invadens IP1]|uniref:C2 domain-containing protein n=1 Tax=Entamoeba invadens IP1 TaxID=370355 RepID=A0A0A1UGB7_ENTIV|nr:hypothetical protein EIN_341110 [Entamoeba invadens IP1]ELP94743.1 hypothetical protein EIN_341110 [Entamoeba invadens IP1]|eukprot:XP_004261514.1 hypothetical protein EIN_341110 [Entamoeba invadens IP1]